MAPLADNHDKDVLIIGAATSCNDVVSDFAFQMETYQYKPSQIQKREKPANGAGS